MLDISKLHVHGSHRIYSKIEHWSIQNSTIFPDTDASSASTSSIATSASVW